MCLVVEFLPCDCEAYARYCDWLSGRLSVCPSVERVYCDKTKAPSEKSSIMTNRKSPTSFPMSLRWTSYVAPNPQRLPQKRFFSIFRIKNWAFLEESPLQSFFVWKLSAQSCKAFTGGGLSICAHGWWGTSPSTWNIGPKWPTPSKRRLPIDIRPYCDKTLSLIHIWRCRRRG